MEPSVRRNPEAELAAAFLLDRAKNRWGVKFDQGARKPALPDAPMHGALHYIAERRIRCMCELAASALMRWNLGFPVDLLTEVPSPERVLELQARGARCISLLPLDADTAPHQDAYEFALHDLCHLEKFARPEHYLEQVGFFSALHAALTHADWLATESALDEQWQTDRAHVLSDMNGSAFYLFAVLKMKLKVAARRLLARERASAPPVAGALDVEELAKFDELFAVLLDLLQLNASQRRAAWLTSARRDCPEAALELIAHFRDRGTRKLRSL